MREYDQRILRDQVSVLVGLGDTLLLPAQKTRIGIIISPPKAHDIIVSFDSPAAVGNGIRIPVGSQALVIHGWHLLGALAEDVRVCCDGGTEQVSAVTFFF